MKNGSFKYLSADLSRLAAVKTQVLRVSVIQNLHASFRYPVNHIEGLGNGLIYKSKVHRTKPLDTRLHQMPGIIFSHALDPCNPQEREQKKANAASTNTLAEYDGKPRDCSIQCSRASGKKGTDSSSLGGGRDG